MVELTDRFEMALVYANQLHRGQLRKDGRSPYVAHLLSVAALVLEDGGSEDEAIAALLHDAVEDQGGLPTRQTIQAKFGDRVVRLIDGCTESETIPKPPWLERKHRYLEQIRQACPAVRRISLADNLHNARSLLACLTWEGPSVWNRFSGGRTQTLWFYRTLLDIYCHSGTDAMTQAFQAVIIQLEALEEVKGERGEGIRG
ncbi:MAG: HD domain-containing protein [Cyanobacteria bacterium CRU_2_1]|nr:HD domain-containing protein [Cyanobacteria bacterium CRU_2_1]